MATSADEAARRELMMTAWIHDTYVSPGHMNVGVLVDEKDWQMPMIGKWVCGVLSKHRSYLNWVRFVDIGAVVNQGKTVRQAELTTYQCP